MSRQPDYLIEPAGISNERRGVRREQIACHPETDGQHKTGENDEFDTRGFGHYLLSILLFIHKRLDRRGFRLNNKPIPESVSRGLTMAPTMCKSSMIVEGVRS
jgi:hypothetical protein